MSTRGGAEERTGRASADRCSTTGGVPASSRTDMLGVTSICACMRVCPCACGSGVRAVAFPTIADGAVRGAPHDAGGGGAVERRVSLPVAMRAEVCVGAAEEELRASSLRRKARQHGGKGNQERAGERHGGVALVWWARGPSIMTGEGGPGGLGGRSGVGIGQQGSLCLSLQDLRSA